MTKIQHTGKQFTVTISPEHLVRMGWKKGTDVYIAKDPDRNILYIEEMPKDKSLKTKEKI